jgi:hypothetical protein
MRKVQPADLDTFAPDLALRNVALIVRQEEINRNFASGRDKELSK